MLAALIATRRVVPPAPIFFYTNQFVAATNTFVGITVCQKAAHITTSLPVRYQLRLSLPGAESILDRLNRLYQQIINAPSSDAQIISNPVNLYLSNRIAEVIATTVTLTNIISTMPVALASAAFKTRLQIELALALANLQALGTILN